MTSQERKNKKNTPSFLDLFGSMRVGQLNFSEKKRQAIFNRRVELLNHTASVWPDNMSRGLVDDCLSLTRECHNYVLETDACLDAFREHLPSGSDMFDLIIDQLSRQRRATAESEGLSGETTHAWWDASVEFYRCMRRDSKKQGDRSWNDAIQEYFEGCDEFELEAHRLDVIVILSALEFADTAAQSTILATQIWLIFRGILYAGIFEKQGDTIRQKMMVDDLKGVPKTLAGIALPQLGLIEKLIELLLAFWDTNGQIEKLIKNAAMLKGYFDTYASLLEVWLGCARMVREAVEKNNAFFDEKVLQLQVGAK